ncbi:immunity 22 family protein [Gilliamella sp. ESL0250]|uniref:immunity 22 family protein n=1 Tax=Gilliamella sp. ESL0250 TaxID=2705036 RepID=UPI0015804265|nr:immunity 22 family protein [Gilliamella sp. ESL0250]NUF50237.1 hypothetical protein [Gilliamella sp. ESL0250]
MSKFNFDKVTILLWIGNNFSSDEEYQHYFEEIENLQIDSDEPTSLFCADIGELVYMPERLVMPNRLFSSQNINWIIDKIKVNESEKKKINENCTKLGITTANAVFWYINNDPWLNLEVQKPYKENYNGLKYIGEFNADTKYPSYGSEDLSSDQYLWIGTNFMPVEEYNKYFELDYVAEELDDPDYKVCGFCKDVGNNWYDEDFIGYPKPLKKEIDVGKLIDKLISPELDCRQNIIEKCHQLGITKANALVWYKASEVAIKKPYKENYNGLKYIGVFKF